MAQSSPDELLKMGCLSLRLGLFVILLILGLLAVIITLPILFLIFLAIPFLFL